MIGNSRNAMAVLLLLVLWCFSAPAVLAQSDPCGRPKRTAFTSRGERERAGVGVHKYTTTATLNGVNVQREVRARNKALRPDHNFSNEDTGYQFQNHCNPESYYSNIGEWVWMGEITLNTNAHEVIYTFDRPVTSVDVWMLGLGEKGLLLDHREEAYFKINCTRGTMQVEVISECNPGRGGAEIVNIPLISGWIGKSVKSSRVNDVRVRITASKPFTQLKLEDSSSTTAPSGYLIDLCEESVTPFLMVEKQPVNTTVCTSDTAQFKAMPQITSPDYSGGSMQYQWQQSSNGTNWTDVSGSGASGVVLDRRYTTLSIPNVTSALNGMKYRVRFTYINNDICLEDDKVVVYSTPAVLTVRPKTVITTQPAAYTSLCAHGAPPILSVAASGQSVTYQWYENTTNSNVGGTALSGQTGATYVVPSAYAGTKYYYAVVSGGCGVVTSTVAKVQIYSTSVKIDANPPSLQKNTPNAVTFLIKGDPGAKVTYHVIDNGVAGNNITKVANALGEITETRFANKQMTLVVTKVESGQCSRTVSIKKTISERECAGIPATTFAPTATATTQLNQLTVTRTVEGSAAFSNASSFAGGCSNTYPIGQPLLGSASTYGKKVVYTFEMPVNNVEIWLSGIGVRNNSAANKLKITTNCTGSLALDKIYDCDKKAVVQNNTVESTGLTDAAVRVVATKPYTQLVIEDQSTSTTAGYYGVAICDASVKKSDVLSVTTQLPASTEACTGGNAVLRAAAGLAAGFTGNIAYQWQEAASGTTTWQNSTLAGNSGNVTSGTTVSLTVPVTLALDGKQFRVQFTYTNASICGASLVRYTQKTTFDVTNQTIIRTQPQSVVNTCQGSTPLRPLSVQASGSNLSYQWYSNTAQTYAGAATITTATGTTYMPSTTNIGVNYYFVIVNSDCGVVTSTIAKVDVGAAVATLTVATPTVTICPTDVTNEVSFGTIVTPVAGYELVWYATASATQSLTTTPTIDTNATRRIEADAYVSQRNASGCESNRVKVTLVVDDTTTPTLTLPTAPLVVNCADTNIATTVSTWLASATATDTCGVATLTHNYTAPADYCRAGTVTVTFRAVDTFGNEATGVSTITFAGIIANDDTVTPTVNGYVGKQNAINVLDNDTVGTASATVATVSLTIVTPASGAVVPTLDTTTGIVSVPRRTPAGVYAITYRIATTIGAITVSDTAVVTINVAVNTPTFDVVPDVFTYTGNTIVGNILDNDTINGAPVQPGQVNIRLLEVPSTPVHPTLDTTTGNVVVPRGVNPGTYTITYRACMSIAPFECTSSTVAITVPDITAGDDVFTFEGRDEVGNVLDNDTFDGTATQATPSNVRIDILTTATGGTVTPVLDASTGKVTVPVGTRSGTYTIVYKITKLTPPVLSDTATVTVIVPYIVIGPDVVTYTGPNTPSIIDNDKIDGNNNTATTNDVTVTPTDPADPTRPTIDNTGKIVVPNTVQPGTYTVNYQICTKAPHPAYCRTSTVVVTVEKIIANPDTYTYTGATIVGNVISNDRVNGAAAQIQDLNLTLVQGAAQVRANTATPTLNVTTGEVSVPANVPAGTYTLTYRIQLRISPADVATGVATVIVPYLNLTPDVFTRTSSSTINILDNDHIDGTTRTPSTSDVDITDVSTHPSGPNVPTIDNTGKIVVPNNAAPGTYSITYKVCTKAPHPAHCQTGTAVVVVAVAGVNPDVFTYTGNVEVGNVLDNDFISENGNLRVMTPSDAEITIINTPAGTAPSLAPATGVVSVPRGVAAGTYTITYRVCPKRVGAFDCVTTTVAVVVGDITAANDNYTFRGVELVGNVLDNDTYDGTAVQATVTNVAIAVLHPATGGVVVPVLEATTGEVKVPVGTRSGTYYIQYQITKRTPPALSDTATVTVVVPYLVIVPDVVTHTGTNTPSILDNDRIDGNTRTATTDDVVVTPTDPHTPNTPSIDNNGNIIIPDNATPGTYTRTYNICTKAPLPAHCQSGTVVIVVPKVVAKPDEFTYTGQTVIGNVLTNDKVNGAAANIRDLDVSVVQGATPSRANTATPTLNVATGEVSVPANVPYGVYTLVYQISLRNTSDKGSATVTVKVPYLNVNPDVVTHTGSTTVNILDNDTVDGSVRSTTTNDVEITNIVNTTTGTTVPVLKPDGTVEVPRGTQPGSYTITYDICTKLSAPQQECYSGTVNVVVPAATETVTAQDDRATTAWNKAVVINVLANDRPQNLTPVIETAPANGTTQLNADNTITYQPNTGYYGTDTFTYKICDVYNRCATAVVTIEVIKQVRPNNGITPDGDGNNDYFHIDGIEAFPNNVVRIFNRWGVTVFEVEGYNNTNRVFKGESNARATVDASGKLPQGTYYYIIEYTDDAGNKETKTGFLYLKK